MRFQANPAAMKSLAALGTPLSGSDATRLVGWRWSADDRYDDADERRVGWPSAEVLAGLPSFEFYTGDTGTWLWHVVIFEDRQSHIVYVESDGS